MINSIQGFRTTALLVLAYALLAGCEESPRANAVDMDESPTTEAADNTETVVVSCDYTNRFSTMLECREYTGQGWDKAEAEANCSAEVDATFNERGCATESFLGSCVVDAAAPRSTTLYFPGDDQSMCAETAAACETFAAGIFTPSALCEDSDDENDAQSSVIGGAVFQRMEYLCLPSIDDVMGASEEGKVCTWQSIGGCTEPGRHFADYASCEPVMTQRPFFPMPPSSFQTAEDDPIRQDERFLAEVAWVKTEAEACGCVCCHTSEVAPQGAAAFDTSAPGIWTDTFSDHGLAIAAGWIDSTALGAHDARDNNGFDRSRTGLPTTDVDRMIAFFEGELARRGVERSEFEGSTPTGGPLHTQLMYTPSPCENGEGIARDGTMNWKGRSARYIHVLEAGSSSPGVPPNLDKPDGTLWKLDRSPDAAPLPSGIRYGEIPADSIQEIPLAGRPPVLEEGQTYYLYVLADIGSPITRCLFDYPIEAVQPETAEDAAWGQSCTGDGDCDGVSNYCALQPGSTEGYCTAHCPTTSFCQELGAPESWTCNAVLCDVEAYTWCGPNAEIEESNGFLKVCE